MRKQSIHLPEIIDKGEPEIKHIIALIQKSELLPEEVKTLVIKCLELALWLPLFLQKKNITLHRLRTLIFGKGYQSNKNGSNHQEEPSIQPAVNQANGTTADSKTENLPSNISANAESSTVEPVSSVTVSKNNKGKGHGRMSHTVYEDCTEIHLLLDLKVGNECPTICGGKLGPYKAGVIIRVKGQNFANIYRYFVEKLRCNLCGEIFEAQIPPSVGVDKYDESFKAILALMKYYMAMPFHRQENFQRLLGFRLSDSTQWDLIEQLAGSCYAPFNHLKFLAANGQVIQNDDTSLKILEVIKQIKEGTAGERTGMYTTGVVSIHSGRKIAIFMNGKQHSGENVGDILRRRMPDKEPIIQMCDALSSNIPKTMQTILCNYLSHGFRKFEELVNFFEDECLFIMKRLSEVFEIDAKTHDMNQEKRLVYHQQHSKPIMDELAKFMEILISEHRIEPNSELGGAIKYMQRHWVKLTRFLTVAGAPIENNIVERALKVAIRNRKSAMFYKTVYSAGIGGMLTSLIYTCHLNNQNPHDYLIALQVHQPQVLKNPEKWLPWSYLESMAQVCANPQECIPPSERLVGAQSVIQWHE